MVQTNQTAYFDRFPRYTPDFNSPLDDEFLRLAGSQGWGKKRMARERNAFLLAHFKLHLGEVERSKNLKDWQDLCSELRVSSIPKSITQCKKVLSTQVHVNLIDLMDSRRLETDVKVFRSQHQLVKYTIASRRFFPREEAKKQGLISILLRDILR